MKNIFGVKLDNEEIDGIIFKSRSISYELEERVNKNSDENLEFMKKAKPHILVSAIKYITLFIGIIAVSVFFEILENKSFKEAMPNILYILLLSIGFFAICILIFIYEHKKVNKIKKSDEFIKNIEENVQLATLARNELKIPDDAKEIDTFLISYVDDENGIKPNKKIPFDVINFTSIVFIENNNLCFSDMHYVLSIPLDNFIAIKTINKKIKMFGWNKEVPFNKGEYKQYKIVLDPNSFNTYIIKKYYSIQLNNYFNDYEILIPPYELENILSLVNLNVIEDEKKS